MMMLFTVNFQGCKKIFDCSNNLDSQLNLEDAFIPYLYSRHIYSVLHIYILIIISYTKTLKCFVRKFQIAISDIHICIPVMMTIWFNLQYDNDRPWYNFFTTGSSKFRSVYSIIYTAI